MKKILILSLAFCCLLKAQDCKFALVEYSYPGFHQSPDLSSPDKLTNHMAAFGCVYFTEQTATLIATFSNGQANDVLSIPKGSILKVSYLKGAEDEPQSLRPVLPGNSAPFSGTPYKVRLLRQPLRKRWE